MSLNTKLVCYLIVLLFPIFTSQAQTILFESNKVENEIVLDFSANSVWKVISDFNNLPKLVPKMIKRAEVNGNGIYASWLIYLQNEQVVKEEMVYFNSMEMEFAYVMTKTPMPLNDYLSIQKVEAIGENKSKVKFTSYYNALPQNKAMLEETFNDFQNTFLNSIKNILQ